MRKSARVLIVQDGKVALIKREKNNQIYFVLPGGGVEGEEGFEQAALREAYEELGVRVEIIRLVTLVRSEERIEYLYEAKVISGMFGTGKAHEFSDPLRGKYFPMWLDIKEVTNYDLRPSIVKGILTKKFINEKYSLK
ncbi:NUDIX domain-containing protein [Pseudalkalibacillus caeni]|uniref:NUDIX domain-containing protein n=1 Tax=Exobacillus caeni TaxID=2574798 RepID=A0A5R9F5J2_9BACL|nr:NUDIX domain-containing protein [Pseudalkalibacillus caeni]TLS35744.1 NUDIX domain-containing protein [Pseudalkalibacillus caeni]